MLSIEAESLPREDGSWAGKFVLEGHLSAAFLEFPPEGFPTSSSLGDLFSPLRKFDSYSLSFVKIEACHVLCPN